MSQDVAWCPKHQTAKWCCWFDGHSLTRLGSQKTWVFIFLHRLQIRHSKILLILARPLPIGYFTFYYFSFFLIFNRMDAWSLMRGDAFIYFVCGSRRVNIRLGVLLLIPKSPQYPHQTNKQQYKKGHLLRSETLLVETSFLCFVSTTRSFILPLKGLLPVFPSEPSTFFY